MQCIRKGTYAKEKNEQRREMWNAQKVDFNVKKMA